jgi:hypothetical protein
MLSGSAEIEDLNTKTTIVSMDSNSKPIIFKYKTDDIVRPFTS